MELKNVKCSLESLVEAGKIAVAGDTEKSMFDRIKGIELTLGEVAKYGEYVKAVGVTEEFKKVINTFNVAEGETPAGFKHELKLGADGSVRVDLVRDISYGKNGVRRPTNVLFSGNTANPFEVKTMKDFFANLTTNPQIIYSQFLNNPKANVGGQFKNSYEVIRELKDMVGPGVDISVEITDPFADEEAIFEEISKFEEILTKYQLVVKVPHTGPLNKENINDYINGTYPALDKGATKDFFYGHNLAYKFHEKGYRVNFTLMSDPHQTALALLAKPYFINAFVERRTAQTRGMASYVERLDKTGDAQYREQLHEFMLKNDLLASDDKDIVGAENRARQLLKYRHYYDHEGSDGLDSVRHSLRVIRQSNLPDTRLIICNTKSDQMYYDIDKMLVEDEFADMKQKVILTCEPDYFAKYTSSSTIYAYQRAFLTSVK